MFGKQVKVATPIPSGKLLREISSKGRVHLHAVGANERCTILVTTFMDGQTALTAMSMRRERMT